MIGLKKRDEHGLFAEEINKKIPYYCVKLTKEEALAVEGKIPQIYQTDGRKIFNVIGEDNELTGEKVFYILFI